MSFPKLTQLKCQPILSYVTVNLCYKISFDAKTL